MKWKENEISPMIKHLKKRGDIETLLIILLLTVFVLILFPISNLLTFLFIEGFAVGVMLVGHGLSRLAILNDPKYIKWDEKGIYVITLGKKRVFTPWDQIYLIRKDTVYLKGKYLEAYVLAKKKLWSSNYLIEKRIGEKLYSEWLKHKEA